MPKLASGDHRFNKANERVTRYSSKEVEVRALVEGQFVARRAHAQDFGFVIGKYCLTFACYFFDMKVPINTKGSDYFLGP